MATTATMVTTAPTVTSPTPTISEQVAQLHHFGINLPDPVLEDFLQLNHDDLNKRYQKPPLVEISKTLDIRSTGNKPVLINNIYTHLLRKLQTNNDPINSLPPPPPVITPEHDKVRTTVYFDCQYSRPQKYPTNKEKKKKKKKKNKKLII